MPIMRYPAENITMREVYDRYDENVVHILNGEYDYIEAYPDKNIVNDNGEIVGYFYACEDACIVTCDKVPVDGVSCTPNGHLSTVYNECAQKAVERGSYEDYVDVLDIFAAKALDDRDRLIGRV